MKRPRAGLRGRGLVAALPPFDVAALDHLERRERGPAGDPEVLHVVGDRQLLDRSQALGGERREHVPGHVIEAEAADQGGARVGGDRTPAIEGITDERLLAGRVEVVGPGSGGGLDHRRAVKRERAGARDHDCGGADQLAQPRRIGERDGGDPGPGARSEAGGDRLELRAVAPGEDDRQIAPGQLGGDQPAGIAARSVDHDLVPLGRRAGHRANAIGRPASSGPGAGSLT